MASRDEIFRPIRHDPGTIAPEFIPLSEKFGVNVGIANASQDILVTGMPVGTAAPGYAADPEAPGQVLRDEDGVPIINYPFVPRVAVIDTYSRFPDGNVGRAAGTRLVVSRPVPGNFDIFYQAWDYLVTEQGAQIDGDTYREGQPSTVYVTDDRVLVPPFRPSRTAAYVELDDQPGQLDIVLQVSPDPDNPYARTVDVRSSARGDIRPGEVIAGSIQLGIFPDTFDGVQYRLTGPQDSEAQNHVSHNQIVASGIMRAVTASSAVTAVGGASFVQRRMRASLGADTELAPAVGMEDDIVVDMDSHRSPRMDRR